MNKCVRIIIKGPLTEVFINDVIKQHARRLDLEGTAQVIMPDYSVRIVVSGEKEHVDAFIDALHKGTGDLVPESISVEPFLKDRDYRGVFRIIQN